MNPILESQADISHRQFFGRVGMTVFRMAVCLVCCTGFSAKARGGPAPLFFPSLSERDVVILAEWVGPNKSTRTYPFGSTTFRIVRVAKPHKNAALKANEEFWYPGSHSGKKGQRFLVTGRVEGRSISFARPWAFSKTRLKYLTDAPSKRVPAQKRIAYFLRFFEHTDPLIAQDVYDEFAGVIAFKDLVKSAKRLPLKRLRKLVFAKDANVARLSTYARLLGLCGNANDAKQLERIIRDVPQDGFRLGIDGVISGYLWLTGEKGLKVIDECKILKRDVPLAERYSAMQAIVFLWHHSNGRFKRARLQKSLRPLLDQPDLFGFVLNILARMKDWSVLDRVMRLYGKKPFDQPYHKLAIARYLIAGTKDRPKTKDAKLPSHVIKAEKYLAELQKKDPKTVSQAKRFYF